MTDPGAEFVVAFRVEVNGTAADAVDPIAPLDGFSACFGGHAGTVCAFSKEPDGVVKDAGVGVGCAADFFSGHGVSGEKAGHAGLVVEAGGALAQNALYAANIGDELFRTQDGREIFKPLEDAENGATKQDEVALLGGGDGVAGDFRNCFAAEGMAAWTTSRSHPRMGPVKPFWRRAIPTEPPMSPVPRMAIRSMDIRRCFSRQRMR